MSMNFNLTNTNGTSSIKPRLKPWEIHDVVFKGITFNEFKGKKDPDAVYKTMRISFENENGVYEETVFCPKEGDDVRQVSSNNGVERESPSNFEKFKFMLAHIGEQLAPKKYEAFKTKTFTLPEEFEKLVKTFADITKDAVNKHTNLKLIANKKGEPCLPYFVNISKAGDAYISNNWLGDKVFFSDYEISQMNKQKSNGPTDMPGTSSDDFAASNDAATDNADLDFEV